MQILDAVNRSDVKGVYLFDPKLLKAENFQSCGKYTITLDNFKQRRPHWEETIEYMRRILKYAEILVGGFECYLFDDRDWYVMKWDKEYQFVFVRNPDPVGSLDAGTLIQEH